MKVIGALIAAAVTAAFVFTLVYFFEGLSVHVWMSPRDFVAMSILNMFVSVPVALVGGVPVSLILRHRKAHSPQAFAIAGAALALLTYLLLVAVGFGAPSDRPTTFAENIGRPFQIPRIAFAMLAGASGGIVFRWIAAVTAPDPLDRSPA